MEKGKIVAILLFMCLLLFVLPPFLTLLLNTPAPFPWMVVDSEKMDVLGYLGGLLAIVGSGYAGYLTHRTESKEIEARRREDIRPWFTLDHISLDEEVYYRDCNNVIEIDYGSDESFCAVLVVRNVGRAPATVHVNKAVFDEKGNRSSHPCCAPGDLIELELPLLPSKHDGDACRQARVEFEDVDKNQYAQDVVAELCSVLDRDATGEVIGPRYCVRVKGLSSVIDLGTKKRRRFFGGEDIANKA